MAGYLPSDVHGCSAFNFMLGEDLPWTTLALRSSKDYDKDDFWNKLFVKNLLERSLSGNKLLLKGNINSK